jgi:hypothetical protein
MLGVGLVEELGIGIEIDPLVGVDDDQPGLTRCSSLSRS